MEQYTLIYYVAAWLVTVALLLFAHHLRRPTKLNLPPGPKPLPIIGNLNLMGPVPHLSIHELSKKYGEIMHLKFGSKNIVIGSSVEIAKVFLKTMDANYADRPKTSAGKHTSYNYSGFSMSPYGPYWRQARKMCTTELFSSKRLESYEYIRVNETKLLLKAVHELSGEEIVLKDLLSTLSLNVISQMVFGKKYFDKSKARAEEFKKTLDEMTLLSMILNTGDWIPWIGNIESGIINIFQQHINHVRGNKILPLRLPLCIVIIQHVLEKPIEFLSHHVVGKKFDRFLEDVLNDHDAKRKSEGENFVPSDMVDVLLKNVDDTTLDVKLESHGVKAIVQDLLVGGVEGSAVMVESVISHLLRKPEILKKARDELDRVIGGNRWVAEKDMPNLPYIVAIVKETMRLHPIAPMLAPRRTREDCKVAGYDIPKDTQVMVNVWAIGRDPQLWDNPEEFCPERFIGKEIDVKGNNFELLPFGAGRRMCLGCNLGLKVIESSLANLLHGYSWKLPGKMTREDSRTEEIFGLSTYHPLVTIAHPRLLPEMYYL